MLVCADWCSCSACPCLSPLAAVFSQGSAFAWAFAITAGLLRLSSEESHLEQRALCELSSAPLNLPRAECHFGIMLCALCAQLSMFQEARSTSPAPCLLLSLTRHLCVCLCCCFCTGCLHLPDLCWGPPQSGRACELRQVSLQQQ